MKYSLSINSIFATYLVVSDVNGLSSSSSGANQAATGRAAFSSLPSLENFDYTKNDRLPWIEQGYGDWEWQGHNINYLELGDPEKPALLLIHGFGASAYHYRYNIPELAKDYHVYAFDMLGFGLSSKPIQDYSPEVWRDQTLDFIEQVIEKPTVVVGNSLGGFTALYAASDDSNRKAESLIKGCVLLNAAGRFKKPEDEGVEEKKPNPIVAKISEWIQRAVINISFIYTKQPARIEQVLRQVYPVNADNVDSELVDSIQIPSLDPNASEVFYRVIVRNGAGPSVYVDDLLGRMAKPLLLAWGEEDPWIRPQAADRIQALYPQSKRVSIDAGHCPHDESPKEVNAAILEFAKAVV